jgi:hypothetical protein
MAATWAHSFLGPHNRIGADRTNEMLMTTYGDQDVSTDLAGGVDVNRVLFAPSLNRVSAGLLQKGRLQYLVVDRRLTSVPHVEYADYPQVAVAPALAKFDHIKGVARVFDSGAIQIYDVGVISGRGHS